MNPNRYIQNDVGFDFISGIHFTLLLAVLSFGAVEYLTYSQSVEVATYTYNYTYKVLVYGTEYYRTMRNITYWRVENPETKTTKWERKRFNDGCSLSNSEIVKIGIDNYLERNRTQ